MRLQVHRGKRWHRGLNALRLQRREIHTVCERRTTVEAQALLARLTSLWPAYPPGPVITGARLAVAFSKGTANRVVLVVRLGCVRRRWRSAAVIFADRNQITHYMACSPTTTRAKMAEKSSNYNDQQRRRYGESEGHFQCRAMAKLAPQNDCHSRRIYLPTNVYG